MITEYAIISDVFDSTNYSSEEVCRLRMEVLRECLMGRGVVRDLHGGSWLNCWEAQLDRWNLRAKELVKKLRQQGRLTNSSAHADVVPSTGVEWCNEALKSHVHTKLHGIIADDTTAASFTNNSLVASMSKLTNTNWWIGNSASEELQRTTVEYVKILRPVLLHSNSLMFIDAHLNPMEQRYGSVKQLLQICGTSLKKPVIEVHRACYRGSGENRGILTENDVRNMFSNLTAVARDANLNIEVFVWDNFHDRYLISNLIGINLPNGFDVDMGPPSMTRWSRLDRHHRDNVQKEFHPAAGMHKLRHRFSI